MEGFSREEPTTKERITVAVYSASSCGGHCDLLERAIDAVLKCLGLGPISQPSPKRGDSYDPPDQSTEAARDHLSASEFGMKTLEDVEAKSVKLAGGRSPKPPPIDPGSDPQTN